MWSHNEESMMQYGGGERTMKKKVDPTEGIMKREQEVSGIMVKDTRK